MDIEVKQKDIQQKTRAGQLKNVGCLELSSFEKLGTRSGIFALWSEG